MLGQCRHCYTRCTIKLVNLIHDSLHSPLAFMRFGCSLNDPYSPFSKEVEFQHWRTKGTPILVLVNRESRFSSAVLFFISSLLLRTCLWTFPTGFYFLPFFFLPIEMLFSYFFYSSSLYSHSSRISVPFYFSWRLLSLAPSTYIFTILF